MADEPAKKESVVQGTAEAVKGILEAVPIYQDAVQPFAQQTGKALGTVGRTINALLLPLKAVIWTAERMERFFEEDVAPKLERVPEERRITPDPVVAVPAIEALRLTGDNPDLREMYANLLATAMDSDTAAKAHPAFVEVLRQLTPDEAQSLRLLQPAGTYLIMQVRIFTGKPPANYEAADTFIMRPLSDGSYLEPVPLFLKPDDNKLDILDFNVFGANIERLGIVSRNRAGSGRVDLLKGSPELKAALSAVTPESSNIVEGYNFHVSTFGSLFCEACGIAFDNH